MFTRHFIHVIQELRRLARAGTIPPLWVDGDVIRIPWPLHCEGKQQFRILSIQQAERLIAGEPLKRVLEKRRPPHVRRINPDREPWQVRRVHYLQSKSA